MFNNLFPIIFSLYLGLSPVFWMPFISPFFFTILKSALFVIIALFSVLSSLSNLSSGILNFKGKALVFFTLTFMLSLILLFIMFGDNDSNFVSFVNILQILLFIISSRILIKAKKVYFTLRLSVWILSFFVFLSVVLMLLIPLTVSPFNEQLHLINTGFGGARTGWTPSIGLFVPFLLMLTNSHVLILIYLYSQMLTGGRAGFYLSLLVIPAIFLIEKSVWYNIMMLVLLCIAVILLAIYMPEYFTEFRVFSSLLDAGNSDKFSSGRLTLLMDAWGTIRQSPFLGSGMYSQFEGIGVHNVFIKGWLFYGLIYFLLSILIVFYGLYKAGIRAFISKRKQDKKMMFILFLVLFSGFCIGLIEPSIIFGNFNTFSLWWFCFTLAISNDFLISEESSHLKKSVV